MNIDNYINHWAHLCESEEDTMVKDKESISPMEAHWLYSQDEVTDIVNDMLKKKYPKLCQSNQEYQVDFYREDGKYILSLSKQAREHLEYDTEDIEFDVVDAVEDYIDSHDKLYFKDITNNNNHDGSETFELIGLTAPIGKR